MTTPNQDAFFDGEFYEENSFLVLAKGDELSSRSSANSSLAGKSVESQKSAGDGGGNSSMAESNASVPKPLPRSNISSNVAQNGDKPMDEPISSHFASLRQQSTSAGCSNYASKGMIDQPEVSLASIISSNSSITPSEAESLEESLKLIHILKTENEGLKEILAQRNETLRDEIKSIHSTSAMYESKHADQLQKYEACVKAIAELHAENAKLKEQVNLSEQEKALEHQLYDKESQIKSLESQMLRYIDVVKDCEAKIAFLNEQEKSQKVQNDSLVQERDALQFNLTDARITMANLTDELKRYKAEGTQQSAPNDHLESALRAARLHLTNMKEDNDKKNVVIATLGEQKEFCEAQMKEFEANFKEERDEKLKLAESLTFLQIELEKTKADLAKKSVELEKLHHTHLVLANEHINRNRENSIGSPPGPDEFVYVNRQRQTPSQNIRSEQVQTTPPAPAPAPRNAAEAAAVAMPSAPQQQPKEPPPNACPMCFKQFTNTDAVVRHASNCGMSMTPGTDPFRFP
jgi:hypothetical protein